jgi:hypothetical protein
MGKPDRGERNRRWMAWGGGGWLEGGMACKKKGRDRKKGQEETEEVEGEKRKKEREKVE